jgi:hypothetical protein
VEAVSSVRRSAREHDAAGESGLGDCELERDAAAEAVSHDIHRLEVEGSDQPSDVVGEQAVVKRPVGAIGSVPVAL